MNNELVYIEGLSAESGAGEHNFKVIKDALNTALKDGYAGIVFPKGKFEVYNETAIKLFKGLLGGEFSAVDYEYLYTHHNRLIEIDGVEDFKVLGNCTTLLFDGLISFLDIRNSRNILVKGITVDWINVPYFTADVIGKEANKIEIRPHKNWNIVGGEPIVSIQNVDMNTGAQGGMSLFCDISNVIKENDRYYFTCLESEQVTVGESLVLRYIYNYSSALHFYRCKDVTIEDITLHANPGMGIIGQKVENVNIYRLYVKPGLGRVMSTNTDATHFINCSGSINFHTCYFEGMGDDATNVHGFYHIIKGVEGNRIYTEQSQGSQDGIFIEFDKGHEVEFVSSSTLQPYFVAKVLDNGYDSEKKLHYVVVDEADAKNAVVGDCMASHTEIAKLNFENCVVKNIRGRGALIQTRGAIIRSCLFEGCTGEGIHICTETGWWESIATRDIEIYDNRFINCGFGSTKYCDAVAVVTSTNAPVQTVGVHQNIKINGNIIEGNNMPVLITCAKDVEFKNNTVFCTKKSEVYDSENVVMEDNTFGEYDDALKTSPAVFAVGNEYQIMQPVGKECLYWVKVGDKIYADEINGVMRSRCNVHKVCVPMEELNRAKGYTVMTREIIDRVHNKPQCFDKIKEKEYKFYPIPENGAKAFHISDAHNYINTAIQSARTFGDIDFLILNGDLQCHSAEEGDFLLAYYIADALTKGEKPVVMTRGNHETIGRYAENITDYIPSNEGKTYYTFKLGNIWGMVLDCGSDNVDSYAEYSGTLCCHQFRERQIDFIKGIIENAENEYNAADVEYKLIICHIPFTNHFEDTVNVETDIYNIWEQLINENIKPDLMLSGHTHNYRDCTKENSKGLFPLSISSKHRGNSYFGGTGIEFLKEGIKATRTDSCGETEETVFFEK